MARIKTIELAGTTFWRLVVDGEVVIENTCIEFAYMLSEMYDGYDEQANHFIDETEVA